MGSPLFQLPLGESIQVAAEAESKTLIIGNPDIVHRAFWIYINSLVGIRLRLLPLVVRPDSRTVRRENDSITFRPVCMPAPFYSYAPPTYSL
jgi:hypothetical protein